MKDYTIMINDKIIKPSTLGEVMDVCAFTHDLKIYVDSGACDCDCDFDEDCDPCPECSEERNSDKIFTLYVSESRWNTDMFSTCRASVKDCLTALIEHMDDPYDGSEPIKG